MEREYFLKTDRTAFSTWKQDDIELATLLWGDPDVTRFICASGQFSSADIANRLNKEIENQAKYQVQYWPVFELKSNELIGCCGLRPYKEKQFEIGFHLRPKFWGQGYAMEVARVVIDYAFNILQADGLFAGHNPNNVASKKVLKKLGFAYVGDEFYEPTGLYHPSYELKNNIILRSAKPGDGKILAYIHTESWKAAFANILPEEELAQSTDVEKIEFMYERVLENKANILLEYVDKEPHALASWGKNRNDLGEQVAELICIHSLRDKWNKGYGTVLLSHVLEQVRQEGYSEIMLWVFEENKQARAFYEKHGFVLSGQEKQARGAKEVMYWKAIEKGKQNETN